MVFRREVISDNRDSAYLPERISSPPVLQVEKLVKVYGNRTVVSDVGFEVREGEVVGLLGPNGAGKTTSFRITCGLIAANSGKVILSEKEVTSWPMYRRARDGKMGYLPQDRSVFGSLSTEKNLYLAMELLKIPKSKQRKKCEEFLRKFNLYHVRKTTVGYGGDGGLSGGERRRLEIARALLAEPRILLLDEPFANVDPNTITEIQNVIRDLASEGIAILITDHQIDDTMEITDYCYVISQGKVLCNGHPLSVLSNKEARETYFGKNSDQQLENLKKKFRQKIGTGRPESTERNIFRRSSLSAFPKEEQAEELVPPRGETPKERNLRKTGNFEEYIDRGGFFSRKRNK